MSYKKNMKAPGFPVVYAVEVINYMDGSGGIIKSEADFRVNKAYLIAEKIVYSSFWEPTKRYEVVFFGSECDKNSPPRLDDMNNCINSVIVSDIFSNKKDAEVKRNSLYNKNRALLVQREAV